jgi:hypothetical protein
MLGEELTDPGVLPARAQKEVRSLPSVIIVNLRTRQQGVALLLQHLLLLLWELAFSDLLIVPGARPTPSQGTRVIFVILVTNHGEAWDSQFVLLVEEILSNHLQVIPTNCVICAQHAMLNGHVFSQPLIPHHTNLLHLVVLVSILHQQDIRQALLLQSLQLVFLQLQITQISDLFQIHRVELVIQT